MELDLLQIAAKAAAEIFSLERFTFLFLGVIFGLIIGVIPGLGGLVGLSLLLPFTFDMDPITAFAFLLGLASVTVTSDTIPAVLFGVPGTVGSAATILDGHPMAKNGEAARAFGAAFSASVIGGVLGALLLAVSVPILRPVMLQIATPELLAVCIFGLSLVAVLSGGSALKGITACCIGVALTTIGLSSFLAEPRWNFDTLYLYDGLPIVPITLGLFAVPEIADMVIQRRSISGEFLKTSRWAQLAGIKDSFRNWFLISRSSGIGSLLGAVPGMGASVIDWIAYAHAKGTEKGAQETFGTGDVRGVIASESSNNAKEGGALVPTIAFGVPGSASMALILGVFLIQGLVPGPEMLRDNLDVTYAMVWTVALANIIGGGLCFLFANQLARIAVMPIGLLAPIVLSFIFIGAFQGSSQWGDIAVLFLFGLIGFVMKRMGWPRPPLILGFVLGGLIERYAALTASRYGFEWLERPIVMGILIVTVISLTWPSILRWLNAKREHKKLTLAFKPPRLDPEVVFILILGAVFIAVFASSWEWAFKTKLLPQTNAAVALIALVIILLRKFFVVEADGRPQTYDIADDLIGMERATVTRRALIFAAWGIGFVVLAQVVGFLVAIFLYMLGYIHFDSKKSWGFSLLVSGATLVFNYFLFQRTLNLVWPQSLVGDLWPALRSSTWTGIF